jgi:predicted dehydrogenase
MPIRVGVIGLGIGKVHLQNYQAMPDVEIAAVADVNAEAASVLGAQYDATPYADAFEMLRREQLDAVSVCTPPKHHAPLVVAAAERGIHVLCEKPMAPTLAECDQMIEAAAKAGVTLMIGFKKRYAPAYAYLKEREAEWGQPRIALCRYQLGPVAKAWFWDEADGGGPLIENTAHCLDVLRYLMGDVETVYAETSNLLNRSNAGAGSDVAEAVFTLRFRSGATAAVAAGAAGVWAYDELERLSFSYDRQIVEVYGRFDVPRTMRIMERATEREGAGVTVRTWEDATGFPQEFAAFVECAQGKATPRATGSDGRAALQLGLAIKESGRSGKPIKVGR